MPVPVVVLLTTIACGAAVAPAYAQTRATTADLGGVVRDETGGVLPDVTLSIEQLDTGLVRQAVSGANGRFTVPALPPGDYQVRAELSGFEVEVLPRVTLRIGAAADLTIVLRVAGVAERVEVVAAVSPAINPQRTAIATEISREQIENLPINRRNFISFAAITPGVIPGGPRQGAAASSGLTFAGQRARANNVMIDGLDNNDATVGSVRAVFSQEAVREFQVVTNSYGAEFGHASGGVVNVVTRAGTNTLRGDGFFFYRDRALSAREYFDRFTPSGARIDLEKAPFRQRQFGGILGGPVLRDRTFFFGSYEGLDVDAAANVTIDNAAPVADPRGGASPGTPADVLRAAGFVVETGQVPFTVSGHQVMGRIDHRFSPTNQIWGRFNHAGNVDEQMEPWGGLIARSRGAALDGADYAAAASHDWVRSSRVVNELRGQYAVRDQTIRALDPRCPSLCAGENEGGPTIVVLGVAAAGRQQFTPQPRRADRYQLLNTTTVLLGDHQAKAGVDFNYIETDARLPLAFGGSYTFAALPAIPGLTPAPVSAIQAFALGVPAVYFQGYGNSDASYPYSDLALFVQDDWRLRHDLTLKLGLRYQTQFWPDWSFDIPGLGRYDFPSDRNDLAPRLAAAWNPGGNPRRVVRGSWGLFYDRHVTTIAANAKSLSGASAVRTYLTSLPSPNAVTAWNSPGRQVPEPSTPFPSVIANVDPGLKSAYAHHASAGLDQEWAGIATSIGFVYARGYNALAPVDYNPIVITLGPGRRPLDVDGRPGTSSGVSQYTSYADSWYRALMVSASKRTDRYQVLASYTWSRALDNAADYIGGPEDNGRGRNPQDPTGLPVGFDPDLEKGPSNHDQPHRAVISGMWLAPWGLHVATVATLASGRPYSLSAGFDFNRDGIPIDRPRRDPASAPLDYSTTVGRNTERLPAEYLVDVRIQQRVGLGEGRSADFIIDVFNLFNRVQFTSRNNVFGAGAYPTAPLPTFGEFASAGPPRQIQLGVRVNF